MPCKRPYVSADVLHAYYERAKSMGITVVETSPKECRPMGRGDLGIYIPDKDVYPEYGDYGYPSRSVIILQSLPNYHKLATLFHEMGHDNCASKCSCLQVTWTPVRWQRLRKIDRRESHAWKYCLNTLKEERLWSLLRWTMLEEDIRDEGGAVKGLMKTKWWSKLLSQAVKNCMV